MKDAIKIRGMVTVRVLDKNGCLKRKRPGLMGRLLGLRGGLMVYKRHNIVTREGDALIADSMLATPTRNRVSASTGFMQAGTGWTGSGAKANSRCNAPTGEARPLDAGYPALKAAWGNAGDNTVTYTTTFGAGSLNANGINEVCLMNGNTDAADCLAYAQISPAVNVTADDTLQVLWEITILGQ